ncbi:sensor histidine kinase [Bifidobacterium vespertilionis]|uniref:Histidine kinase n=1 Tax=Bifidobacterium vespertilionis TaxID=2562524 RepID=A0A5J5E215_9BIFI|nr:histidine kinase [Bifidobacterium vespertilionis]KAA8818628.1 hypothetical protein EMO90_09665 [Bifidobacterium vespertilionis]KAA8823083.1 hypothetical protein EM848_06950 [Bifidobacterium vespertilionis]
MNLEHIERHLERRIPALKHLERPYAVLIIAAAVALTLIDGLANHGMSDLVPITTCLYALLVIETYWWSSFSALALVAIAMTAVLVPRIVLPMPVWSLWFVYSMLAYSRRHVMLAVTLALGFAGTVAGVALGRYPLWNMASIVSLDGSFCLAALAGYALVERRRVEEARRLAEENARMRRDVELGSRIHDSVTQGLTAIALTADRLRTAESVASVVPGGADRPGGPDGDLDDGLAMIASTARRTLGQVRSVIDVLNGRDEAFAAAPASDRLPALRAMVREGDDRLRRMGFEGRTTIEADGGAAEFVDSAGSAGSAAINPVAWRELVDLLGQLATNIAVHADPQAGAYAIDVRLETGANGPRATVTQSNGVAAAHEGLQGGDRVPHSGRGLALHRARIEALGGSLHTSLEDGVWVLSAVIPLASSLEGEA